MKRLILILAVFVPGLVLGADIIPASRLALWTNNVGVSGGIPVVSTVYTTLTAAASAATIQTALNNCPSNQAVVLGAWTNTITQIDWQGVDDGVVLRGSTNSSGDPTTQLTFSSGNIYMRSIYDTPHGRSTNLSANFTKGSTTISLSSGVPTWVIVGELYVVNELNDSTLISETTDEGADPYETGRALGHIVKVTAKDSTSVTVELPSPYTYRTSQTAHLTTANYDPAPGVDHRSRKRCGIENIKIEHTYSGSGTSHGIFMENNDNCWVKNIRSYNVAGGIHVMNYGGYRCEVRGSTFSYSHLYNGGQGYGVAFYEGGAGHLVYDNIFHHLHVPIQFNYSVAQCVAAYNMIAEGIADVEQDPGMNQHGVVAFQILWEGNWSGPKFMADDTHGSGGYLSTVFRNRISGYSTNGYTYDRSAVNLRRYCRSFNVVGNVLGTTNYHTIYERQANTTYSDTSEKVIWVFGYGTLGNYDNAGTMDVLRAVNYDTVTTTNAGIVNGGYTTSDLVNSYYLESKPTEFGSLSWPPFSPASTNMASIDKTNIPAGYRYVYGTNPPASGGGGSSGNRSATVSGTFRAY